MCVFMEMRDAYSRVDALAIVYTVLLPTAIDVECYGCVHEAPLARVAVFNLW